MAEVRTSLVRIEGRIAPGIPGDHSGAADIPDTGLYQTEDNLVKIGPWTRLAAIEKKSGVFDGGAGEVPGGSLRVQPVDPHRATRRKSLPDVRCWFYRFLIRQWQAALDGIRKGGSECYAYPAALKPAAHSGILGAERSRLARRSVRQHGHTAHMARYPRLGTWEGSGPHS